jgi:hypothetical protein
MKCMLLALVVMALLMLPLAMPAVAQGDGGSGEVFMAP